MRTAIIIIVGCPDAKPQPDEAPSPAARFPATAEGWADALAYAETKGKAQT